MSSFIQELSPFRITAQNEVYICSRMRVSHCVRKLLFFSFPVLFCTCLSSHFKLRTSSLVCSLPVLISSTSVLLHRLGVSLFSPVWQSLIVHLSLEISTFDSGVYCPFKKRRTHWVHFPSSTCSHSRQSWGPCWLGWQTSGSRCGPHWWWAVGGRGPPPPSPWSDWALSGCASKPSWCADAPWCGSPEQEGKDRQSGEKKDKMLKVWLMAHVYYLSTMFLIVQSVLLSSLNVQWARLVQTYFCSAHFTHDALWADLGQHSISAFPQIGTKLNL